MDNTVNMWITVHMVVNYVCMFIFVYVEHVINHILC